MRAPTTPRAARAGFTMLEMVIATVLLGVVASTIALVTSSGVGLFRTSVARTDLEARARRAVSNIQEQLLDADHRALDTFPQVPLWDEQLTFDQPSTFARADGEIGWSSTRIELRYEEGELDDGLDNDGDGLVDEGEVVLVRDWNGPNEFEVVLCRGVAEYLEGESMNAIDDNGNLLADERGLTFDLRGEALTIRLSLQASDSTGLVLTRTFETAVWLRN